MATISITIWDRTRDGDRAGDPDRGTARVRRTYTDTGPVLENAEVRPGPLFDLGEVSVTDAARAVASRGPHGARGVLWAMLSRHRGGDWGEMTRADARANDAALDAGMRLLSVYDSGVEADPFWVMTPGSREMTTVMLASDY